MNYYIPIVHPRSLHESFVLFTHLSLVISFTMYVQQALFAVLVSTSLTVLASPDQIGRFHGLKAARDGVVAREPSYLDAVPRGAAIDERDNMEPRKAKKTTSKTTPVEKPTEALKTTEAVKPTEAEKTTTTSKKETSTSEVPPPPPPPTTSSTKTEPTTTVEPPSSTKDVVPTTTSSVETTPSVETTSKTSLKTSTSDPVTLPTSTSSKAEEASVTDTASEPGETSGSGWSLPDNIDYNQLWDLGTKVYGEFDHSSTADDYAAASTVDDAAAASTATGYPVTMSGAALNQTVGASGVLSGTGVIAQSTTAVANARRVWEQNVPRYVKTTFVTSTTMAV